MSGPLAGHRVLEFAGIGPGPFAGMMLADLGADVVVIDRPGAQLKGPASLEFLRRGKRSVALDLKSVAGRARALELVEKADALIEGFRPKVMERLGLGPQDCLRARPALVYGRMTGWGQNGPLAQRAGHDINYLALTGALHSMGSDARGPMVPLNIVGDFGGGGMLLALGLVSAMVHAQRTGIGQVVDASIVDGGAALMTMIYSRYAMGLWEDRREANLLDGGTPYYSTYQCADGGWVAVGAIEQQFFTLLLEKLGIAPEEYGQRDERSAWPRQRSLLARVFAQRTRDAWATLLEPFDVCVSPVLSLAEAQHHAHNVERGVFLTGATPQPAPAPRFSHTACEPPEQAHMPGSHDAASVWCDPGDTLPQA